MRPNLIVPLACAFFLLALVLQEAPDEFAPPFLEAAEKEAARGKRRRDFAGGHFSHPLPPMGEAPESYAGAERSLLPERCGGCHPEQYAEWKTSLHARAMGPGVYGQLVDMWRTDPEGARGCHECHAPLAEQRKRLKTGAGASARWRKNPAHDARLERSGLSCAACHVRAWRVHGPPRKEPPAGADGAARRGAHAGVERAPFFSRSEFCASCHQHAFPGPNGKPIQNTYGEWKNSIWGREGVACQSCHMPGRAHLWRGIHDEDMTRGAVRIEVALDEEAPGEIVAARIRITNSGAGHYFPTYITPSVEVVSRLEDASGRALPGSGQINAIGRRLSPDFSREIRDTRIPPQQSVTFRYRRGRLAGAARLRVRVRARPDAFYEEFFDRFLARPGVSELSRGLIERARDAAAASGFDIYDEAFELKP